MSRARSALGALAALATVGCTGTGETEPVPPVEGCVDLRVATDLLPDPSAYSPHGLLIRGGVWLTDGRVHVAWEALRWSDAVTVPPAEDRHPELIVSSFDAQTGDLVDQRVYDIFPPHVGPTVGALFAAGGERAGRFAVLYEDQSMADSATSLMLDDLLAPSALVIAAPEDVAAIPCAVAWDGEAFAVHSSGGADAYGGKEFFVARVAPDGSVLLPFTLFGSAKDQCYYDMGLDLGTVPETGITYAFATEGGRWVVGHERDGTPLPGTFPAPKVIDAIGTTTLSSEQESLGVGVDGAWVAWGQYDAAKSHVVLAQRLDLDGDPVGNALEVHGAPAGLAGVPIPLVIVARPGTGAWFGGTLTDSMFGAESDGTAIEAPWTFFDGSGDDRPLLQQQRYGWAFAADDGDGAWVAFQEYVHSGTLLVVRVVRAKRGCVYPSLEKAAREGLP